jgi:hypothetical protein
MANELKANESTAPQPVPVVTNPDNIRAVYANNAGFGATMTDVEMIFTQVAQGIGAKGELRPENRVVAIVTIPIMQVAQAIAGLSAVLSAYQGNAEAFKKQREQNIAAQKK